MTAGASKATAVSDYVPVASGRLDFADAQTWGSLEISIVNDTVYESPDERFAVVLENATAGSSVGSRSSADVTIVDDGDAGTFEFSASAYSVREDGGVARLTINRVGGSSGAV